MQDSTKTDQNHQEHPNIEPEKSTIHVEEGGKNDPHAETAAEKDITISRLRAQNEKLRSQLKELSSKMTETLERVKIRKSAEKVNPQDFRDDTLKKELENANKQITNYKKDIEKLKFRIQATHTEQKVTQLENLLVEKDRVITELTSEKKNMEKIKRDQEKQIGVLQNDRDYNTRLNMYAEEVKGLKEKIKELQKNQQQEGKTAQKQQEFLINLEQKYREVCEKAGISPSLNVTRAEENNRTKQLQKSTSQPNQTLQQSPNNRLSNTNLRSKVISKTVKNRNEGSGEHDGDEEKLEFNEDNFNKLKKEVKILKNSKISTERKLKGDIDQLNSKLKELEYDNKELSAKFKEKEKESNITNFKYNEMKRVVRHNQLNPIVEKPDNQKINVDTTKSADLSKMMELSKPSEASKARSDTPKGNQTISKANDQSRKQNNSKSDFENLKPSQEKKAAELQKDVDEKKSVQKQEQEVKPIKQVNSKSDADNTKSTEDKKPAVLQKDVDQKKNALPTDHEETKVTQPTEKQEVLPSEQLEKNDNKPEEKTRVEEHKDNQQQPQQPEQVQTRREVKGRYDSTLEEFDDEKLPHGKRINHLTVWYDDNYIYGLKALYTLPDGSDVAGTEHLNVADKSNLKSDSIEIAHDDHIANFSGKYKQSVGYLKIVTAQGKTHEFGGNQGTEAEHEFDFTIEAKEIPLSIFGALDKIGDEKPDLALAYIGLMIEH